MSTPSRLLSLPLSIALLAGMLVACEKAPTDADWLGAALQSKLRDDDRARDRWRHPRQTLEFFGLRPDMTVVELWPGGGWYSRILGPVLRKQGMLYAAHIAENGNSNDYVRRLLHQYRRDVKRHSALSRIRITELGPGRYDIAPPGSADLVLSFRNTHNWMRLDELPAVFAAAHRALKPGGVFGIVQHRAPAGYITEWMKKNGYVDPDYTRRLIVAAGFEFVASSEINANPKDTADHPNGVWSLPPALRGGDEDRERYLAIGESDRFTMKFIKR